MISIITTTFNSSKHIEKFYNKIIFQIKKLKTNYELIIVDDCSQDNTKEILFHLSKINKKVKLILLSKNLGQAYAINIGLKNSKGSILFLTDSDNEEKGNNLINLYKEIKLKKFDLIYSIRKIKQKNFFNNFLKIIFINLFRLIHKNVYSNQSWLRIFNKKYKKSILSKEINYYPIGHELSKNFFIKKKNIYYKYKGYSAYKLSSRIDYAFEIIVNYSNKFKFYCLLFFFLISDIILIIVLTNTSIFIKIIILLSLILLLFFKYYLITNFIKKKTIISKFIIKKINF